jgi:endogenous inhibitor of DNA gyrase (YacG/DUF329 family)
MTDESTTASAAPPTRVPTSSAATCALCGKPQVERYKPFCSKRCSDIDLNRWLFGRLAVPAPPADHDDDVFQNRALP